MLPNAHPLLQRRGAWRVGANHQPGRLENRAGWHLHEFLDIDSMSELLEQFGSKVTVKLIWKNCNLKKTYGCVLMGLKNEALTWRMDPVTKLNIFNLSNIFWASAAAPKWPKGIFPGLRPSTIIQKCLWHVIFGISWDKNSYDMLFLAYHETMTHHEAQQAGRAKKNNIFLHPQKKPSKLGSLKSCGLHHSIHSYYPLVI